MSVLLLRNSIFLAITVFCLSSCAELGMRDSADVPVSARSPDKLAPPAPIAIHAGYSQAAAILLRDRQVASAMEFIESSRQQNNQTLIELTEIPAPPFGEEKRALRLAEMIRGLGLTAVSIDEVGNVVARRHGSAGQRTVAIAAHIDTVFPIETDVRVRQSGNTYTAPGIGDNSRGLVVMLNLIQALQAADIQTEDDLLFVGTVGEEGLGDLRGIKHLFRPGAEKIDALIAIDGDGLDRLVHGGVGSYRYRITYRGPGGHSWGAFGLANPHQALANAMQLLAERATDVTVDGPKTSFNVGRIGGGTSINSIPFESWMEVDLRSKNKPKLDAIDAVFIAAVQDGLNKENARRAAGPKLTVDIDKVGERPAGMMAVDDSLVQQSLAAMQAFDIQPSLTVSSTDANIPISMGIPAVTLSRGGSSTGAHSLHETWTDENSDQAIKLVLLIMLANAGYVSN